MAGVAATYGELLMAAPGVLAAGSSFTAVAAMVGSACMAAGSVRLVGASPAPASSSALATISTGAAPPMVRLASSILTMARLCSAAPNSLAHWVVKTPAGRASMIGDWPRLHRHADQMLHLTGCKRAHLQCFPCHPSAGIGSCRQAFARGCPPPAGSGRRERQRRHLQGFRGRAAGRRGGAAIGHTRSPKPWAGRAWAAPARRPSHC